MRRTKSLLLSLAMVSVFCSFAVRPQTKQPSTPKAPFCSQWVSFCNNGSVDVEDATITKYPTDHMINNLTPGNCDNTGPSTWGWGTEPIFDFKIKLATGQNGSIRVFESGIEVYCEPTNTSTQTYRFQVDITGCKQYDVIISTNPC